MSVELLYTSAVQGLKQGSRGFCTVISTAGMPINLATRLEGLSAYRHIYPPNHPEAGKNPVNYSHLRINVGGRPVSILSRVADYGIDYSQRTNKLAHHVVVEAHEQTPAGPAWLMQSTSILRSRWDGQCATPASGPTIPMQDQAGKICTTWKSLSGDAGWGGVVADTFASAVGKPLWIIYDLGQREQLLTLLNEAIALLPHEKRWSATFSTYATNVPPDADCKVRCVPAGSDDARLAPAMGKVIDLTKKQAVPAVTELVTAAREGIVFSPKPVPSAPRPMAVETPQVHSTARQPDVNDFELVEDDFEMKLKPIGPPSVNSSHLPPSPPPAVRSRRTPQPNYAQLAPDTPDSNSWMKWALVGASVTIVCLMIALGVLAYPMKSKDVAQKEQKPDGIGQGEDQSEVEGNVAPVVPKPLETSNQAGQGSGADSHEISVYESSNKRDIADDKSKRIGEIEGRDGLPGSVAVPPENPGVNDSKPESPPINREAKENEIAAADDGLRNASKTQENESIQIAKLDTYQLVMEGKVSLTITVNTNFQSDKRLFYKDQSSPPTGLKKISLPHEWITENESKLIGKVAITSLDPFTIFVVPYCENDHLKESATIVHSEWGVLKKDVSAWKKKYPKLKINFEDPKRREEFSPFREKLKHWDALYSELNVLLEKDKKRVVELPEVDLQRKSVAEDVTQLNLIDSRVRKIRDTLDVFTGDEVFNSGTVFFTSDAEKDAIPPGVEGREPFSFKYRIESGLNGDVAVPGKDTPPIEQATPQVHSEVGKS